MSVAPYPEYKDSGSEWIGRVPAGWKAERLKAMTELRPSGVDKHVIEGELPVKLCNYVDVYKNDRITADLAFMEATATQAEIERFTLVAGDVLITKDSETPEDIGVAALVEHSAAGSICGYHLTLLRPRTDRINGAFLFWSMKAAGTLKQLSTRAQGITRFGLTNSAIGNVLLALPSMSEQSAIAAFLDQETGKIDALVAEQERLIALLKEKRQAVISQAVTKGLNPNALMKDSGIEWLGQVPAHWELGRLKQFGALQGGSGFPPELQGLEGEEFPFYKVGDLGASEDGMRMGQGSHSISRKTAEELRAKIIPIGSILYAKIGAALLLNRRRITTVECCIDNNLSGYIPNQAWLRSDWAFYWLSIIDFGKVVNPGAVPSFSEGDQSILPIIVPPLPEQDKLIDYLDAETRKLDTLTTEATQAITLLRERRAALISAAVTGKIDVRSLAPTKQEAA